MTQEDKELLLKDLCARLPYGVMLYVEGIKKNIKLFAVEDTGINGFQFQFVKPYLRSMSSMTEDEIEEYNNITLIHTPWGIMTDRIIELINFLNSRHFDYRGLIDKGIALEAPKDMYKFD